MRCVSCFPFTIDSDLVLNCIQALLLLKPKRIAIKAGYHGVHGVIEIYKRERGVEVIDLDDEYKPGDICWLETPLNPTGEARSVSLHWNC